MNKRDLRVAYIEISLLNPTPARTDFRNNCLMVSEQTEDGHVVFDPKNGYLQVLTGVPEWNEALGYFAAPGKKPGIVLFVRRRPDETWQTYIYTYQEAKWQDVTAHYLAPLHLDKLDYLMVPQYGRAVRVLHRDGERFHHKEWLLWNGTEFEISGAKSIPGWRCPDGYKYFEPEDRPQYCQVF